MIKLKLQQLFNGTARLQQTATFINYIRIIRLEDSNEKQKKGRRERPTKR